MDTPQRHGRPARAAAALFAAALALAACGDDTATDATAGAAESTTTASAAESTTTASAAGSTTTTAGAAGGAVVENCGIEVAADAPPRAAVTMNQAATEVMLSLGLADHLVGTAYLDDAVLPELEAEYSAIPVVSDEYPSREVLLELEPDFVYASYPSAFGEEVAGDRAALAELGIGSYLSPPACPDAIGDDEPLTFDVVFDEITDIATIFGMPEAGHELVAAQQALLDESQFESGPEITVFWWDGGVDSPTAGVCCGAPGMIMTSLGVENLFGDVAGSWAQVSWEEVVAADPDLIVLVDAAWDPAADKRAHLEDDPALSELTAVGEGRYVEVPFSSTTPGVRNAAVVGDIAAAIEELGISG